MVYHVVGRKREVQSNRRNKTRYVGMMGEVKELSTKGDKEFNISQCSVKKTGTPSYSGRKGFNSTDFLIANRNMDVRDLSTFIKILLCLQR